MSLTSRPLFHHKMALPIAAALMLGGCASFSPDGGFGAVETITRERLDKQTRWIRSDADRTAVDSMIRDILARPLSLDDAIQIALLNNRGLQASYAELGIAEADLVQSGRPRNPGFVFERTRQGDDTLIGRTFTFDLLQWLTAPISTRVEQRHFEKTRLLVADAALQVATETGKAWIEAVAARQSIEYQEQVKDAAEAGAELARRMARAGNWSKLDQAREQLFYAEASAQLARARRVADASRERLTRLLGLWGEATQFRLPERLPDLPQQRLDLRELERMALRDRLDVQAAKLDASGMASALGLTRTTRFVNVLELGHIRNSESGRPRETGYEISLEIPLFDWGGTRVARAEATYMRAVNRVAEQAINARSEVREAHRGYLTAHELARHYRDEIVPLRKSISDENLLRYNGMLIGSFELLADAREQVTAVNAYLEALKDFWISQADLQRALGGKLPAAVLATHPPIRQDSTQGQQP